MRITKIGIPSGGNTSQVLTKVSSTNYDVEWASVTPSSSSYSISTKTTTYTETATSGEIILLGDTTTAGFTITLPTAIGNTAKITIKKIAGSNNLTIDGNGSQTIDGGLTAILVTIYESITLVSDNSNWHII